MAAIKVYDSHTKQNPKKQFYRAKYSKTRVLSLDQPRLGPDQSYCSLPLKPRLGGLDPEFGTLDQTCCKLQKCLELLGLDQRCLGADQR